MTEAQDNSRAASIDVQSERGELTQRLEIVQLQCGHCKQGVRCADGKLLRLYDQGARITIVCPACKGGNVVMQSRIIKASGVPGPGGLNPQRVG